MCAFVVISAHLLSRKWALQVALTALCCLSQNIWRVSWIDSFVLFHINSDKGLLLWLLWEVVHVVTAWVFSILVLPFIFINFYFFIFAPACLYVNHMCAVTAQANRRHQIPWHRSYKPLWATSRAETFNKRAINHYSPLIIFPGLRSPLSSLVLVRPLLYTSHHVSSLKSEASLIGPLGQDNQRLSGMASLWHRNQHCHLQNLYNEPFKKLERERGKEREKELL